MPSSLEQISEALDVLYGTGTSPAMKNEANAFLLQFQRSKDAWGVIFPVFESQSSGNTMKLFMAQTLRSKIQYDFGQLPEESIKSLRESVLALILNVNKGSPSNLIVRQLAISLAYLALQDFSWTNGVQQLIETLPSNGCLKILLEFLRILPEEMVEVEKTPLTTEEFEKQTDLLLTSNMDRVLFVINELTGSPAIEDMEVMNLSLNCFKSWLFDLPVDIILQRFPNLWQLVMKGFQDDESFDTAVDCLITIISEINIFGDDDDLRYVDLIQLILNFLISLEPFIESNWDDSNIIERLTELFSITIESWHNLIVKNPENFEKLINIELKLTSYPDDLDIIKYTFKCWSDLKSMLVLPPYKHSREMFKPIYLKLVSILISHLSYPMGSDSTDLTVLFNGNKETEDKFKDSRYEIGDTLKDCCSVAGSFNTLSIPFEKLQRIINAGNRIKWQEIEALLFSIRCMAKEVQTNENKILPEIMNYLIQLPENPKVRYAAILVLGRYTIWTSKHPEFMEMELDYISKGFQIDNSMYSQKDKDDIIMASSHALKYFCIDCSDLLVNYLPILHQLYMGIESGIDIQSNYDIIEGLSHVIHKVILSDETNGQIDEVLKMFWGPILSKLEVFGNLDAVNDTQATEIADTVEIISIYIENLKPRNLKLTESRVANIVMESVLPIVFKLVEKFGRFPKVSERCLKLIRKSIQTFKEYLMPKIEDIGKLLILGYGQFEMGCYLWVSGSLIAEYCDERFPPEVLNGMWEFSQTQIKSFMGTFEKGPREEMSTLCDDFFRMMRDVLMFQPLQLLQSNELVSGLFDISLMGLEIFNEDDTLGSILSFLIELFMWGDENPPISFVDDLPVELKMKIHEVVKFKGGDLIKKLLNWEIYKFSYDVQIDCLELIVQIIKLSVYQENSKVCLMWIDEFLGTLPSNFINSSERTKLLKTIETAIDTKNFRKVRSGINDFIGWYKRKIVSRNY